MERPNVLEQYKERSNRFSDKSIDQLSFFNNLLLTLSVAFLAYIFKEEDFRNFSFTTTEINWKLSLEIFSLISTMLTILLGLFVVLTRLYDFRITRHINQTRYRIYKHSETLLSEKTPERYNFFKGFFVLFKKAPKIKIEDCKNYGTYREQINNNFMILREISYNVGVTTWRSTIFQSVFFGFSVIFYFLYILL